MRSDRKRNEGEAVFVREDLTKVAQESLLKNRRASGGRLGRDRFW